MWLAMSDMNVSSKQRYLHATFMPHMPRRPTLKASCLYELEPSSAQVTCSKARHTKRAGSLCSVCMILHATRATVFGAVMTSCMICICFSCLKGNASNHLCVRRDTQQMTVIMLTDNPESIDMALTSLQPLKGCDSMQGLYVN